MATQPLPVDLRELYHKLEFLAMIKKGFKLNTQNYQFDPADSWLVSITRSIRGQNRKLNREFVEKTVDQAVDAIHRYSSTPFIPTIIRKLNRARQGISEMEDTYITDPDMVSKIRVILTNVDTHISLYEKYLEGDYKTDSNISNDRFKSNVSNPISIPTVSMNSFLAHSPNSPNFQGGSPMFSTPPDTHDSPDMNPSVLHSPVLHSPVLHSPDLHSPDLHSPDLHSPDLHSPDLHSPDLHSPNTPEYDGHISVMNPDTWDSPPSSRREEKSVEIFDEEEVDSTPPNRNKGKKKNKRR